MTLHANQPVPVLNNPDKYPKEWKELFATFQQHIVPATALSPDIGTLEALIELRTKWQHDLELRNSSRQHISCVISRKHGKLSHAIQRLRLHLSLLDTLITAMESAHPYLNECHCAHQFFVDPANSPALKINGLALSPTDLGAVAAWAVCMLASLHRDALSTEELIPTPLPAQNLSFSAAHG